MVMPTLARDFEGEPPGRSAHITCKGFRLDPGVGIKALGLWNGQR
jgi:hypothetical protein